MKPCSGRRRGVASVVGTVLFVVVMMAALGGQAYVSSLQVQSSQIAQQAQTVAAQKAEELLLFSNPSSGLTATDSGPTTTKVVAMFMKFENGTVYSLSNPPTGSNPTFGSAMLPASTGALVQSLVPSGVCRTPSGTATCLSKLNSIVNNPVAGRSVGLLTSLGNTFWYVPATNTVKWSSITSLPPGCAANQYATAVGTALTCSQVGWAQLTGYPSSCASNQYVTAVGTTLTCSSASVAWSQIAVFPSGCPAGQFVSALGVTPTCGKPALVKVCDVTLSTAASSITCSSLPAYTHYSFQYYTPNGCTGSCFSAWDPYIQFNGDTTQSYTYAEVVGSVTTPGSCSGSSSNALLTTCIGGIGPGQIFTQGIIWNALIPGGSAQVTGETAAGSSLAAFGGSWTKNVQISSVTIAGSPTAMAVGTELVIWGVN